jgi:tRNA threonylcarbamoyladenosine biosynthesis protein TsaE
MNLISPGARSKRNGVRQRVLSSRSPDETQDLGFQLAQELTVPCVVLLIGTLGSGKTTLTRGLARGLGLEDPGLVNSPSFTLVNTYPGRCPIYHVDLYRLEGDRDLYSVGLDEFLGKQGVTIIEWGDRLPDPGQASLIVELEDAGEESRIIRILGPERVKSNPRRH